MTKLQKRVLSSVVLIPLILWVIYVGGWIFTGFVIVLAILMLYEWFTITKGGSFWWKLLGILYIGLPCTALVLIRNEDIELIIMLPIIVWATDIGAYFIGKKFGKKKLAPKISPNKTWAGFFGGIGCAIILSYVIIYSFYPPDLSNLEDLLLATLILSFVVIIFSIFSQLGCLFKSWIKRRFGVKDTGNIISGHGGILDRIDGLLFVTLIYIPLFLFLKGEIEETYCYNGIYDPVSKSCIVPCYDANNPNSIPYAYTDPFTGECTYHPKGF